MRQQRRARESGARESGFRGEDRAAKYLETKGYQILARNVHITEEDLRAELDIVAFDPAEKAIVFVEVKFRSTDLDGCGVAAVAPAQLKRIRLGGVVWLQSPEATAWRSHSARVDIVDVGPDRVRVHLMNVW